MTTMITEVYDALRDAQGVSDEKARKAAEAVAAFENRFAALDVRLERMEGRMTLVQWQLALLIGGVVALVLKAFA